MALTKEEEDIVKAIAARATKLAEIDAINSSALAQIKVIDDKRLSDIAAKNAEIAALKVPKWM